MPMETSIGTEYRLQTQESSQWYDTLRQEEADLRGNMQRVENIRVDMLHKELRGQVAKVRLTQAHATNRVRSFLALTQSCPKMPKKKSTFGCRTAGALMKKVS